MVSYNRSTTTCPELYCIIFRWRKRDSPLGVAVRRVSPSIHVSTGTRGAGVGFGVVGSVQAPTITSRQRERRKRKCTCTALHADVGDSCSWFDLAG